MGHRIDQFCEDLRLKLAAIDEDFDRLKVSIAGKNEQASQAIRGHLAELETRIDEDRAKVSAARVQMTDWVDARKVATKDAIAQWRAKREISKLQDRADAAERYALAALSIALSAVDEAEQAALEAWLAREDATFAQA